MLGRIGARFGASADQRLLGSDPIEWMKNPDNFITCCTDGIKPVVFKIERLEE